jgi:putative tryptophan/tyrosine transport system substrate-binding protein
VRRRELMLLLACAMAAPRTLRAQQKAIPVIGFLGAGSTGPYAPYVGAFRQGLSGTGYVEGQNVAIEYRWAEGRYDRLPALAADLVSRKVDLIAALGGTSPALAAQSRLVARIGRWRRRVGGIGGWPVPDPGQSPCHSKRTKIAVITSRSSGTE